MKKIIAYTLCFIISTSASLAGILKFDANTKYQITSQYSTKGCVALGANHGINSPLCVERNAGQMIAEDCYWYFDYTGNGKYAIRNASTSQYVTLDDQYTNTPQILRYIHLSDSIEKDASLWYIKATKDASNNDVFYFQSANDESYFFNLRTGSFVLGAYEKGAESIPSGTNEIFKIYDERGALYTPVDRDPDPTPDPDPDPKPEPGPTRDSIPDDTTDLIPITGPVIHIYRVDGKVEAIPQQYITNKVISTDSIKINTINGSTYSYAAFEVDSVSTNAPKLPHFQSFKFNNKYNHNIIGDAMGVFYGDSLITAYVVGIGKNLRPSFKLNDNEQAWIGDKVQTSKVSAPRFDHGVLYTIAQRGYTILRQKLDSTFVTRPYGSQTMVKVDFATDHSTAPYSVPTVRITTNDGSMISSKTRYWDAKITIDGAGIFPDMPETDMQIKGRGNSSWAGTWGKSPYHIKFATGVKPLGLTKGKHWNLIANAQKLSMTTNAIAMKMAQLVETAGFNHEIPIELYINGQYRGAYNLTEKIGFSNNSIDLPSETYATMLELDSYYDDEQKFRTNNYNLPVNIKEPTFSEGTTALTEDMVKQSFNRVVTALAEGKDISHMVDLDYLARFLFVDEFTANFELMHPKSTFCYNENIKNSDSKYIFGPVWDFDWGYGYSGGGQYFKNFATIDYWNRTGGAGQPWANKQRYCGEEFDKIYYNLWHDFVTSGKLDELIDFCDDYYYFAAKSFSHDNTMWKKGDANDYYDVTTRAKDWLRTRANYVVDYMTNTLGYGSKNYLTSHLSPIMGDVNGDGRITTADIVCVLNYILGLPNEEFHFTQADIDKNDIVTVADLIRVRNLIGSANSKGFYGLPVAEASIEPEPVSTQANGVEIPLTITADQPNYCAVQFDLNIPSGMVIEDIDYSKSIPDFNINIAEVEPEENQAKNIDRYRVSLYSSAKNVIPQGNSTISLVLDWGSHQPNRESLNATLSNIMFVSKLGEDERTYSRSAEFCHNDITGIDDAISTINQNNNGITVSTNKNTTMPIYTIDGRTFRVYTLKPGIQNISLPAGIYIINKQKIIVR